MLDQMKQDSLVTWFWSLYFQPLNITPPRSTNINSPYNWFSHPRSKSEIYFMIQTQMYEIHIKTQISRHGNSCLTAYTRIVSVKMEQFFSSFLIFSRLQYFQNIYDYIHDVFITIYLFFIAAEISSQRENISWTVNFACCLYWGFYEYSNFLISRFQCSGNEIYNNVYVNFSKGRSRQTVSSKIVIARSNIFAVICKLLNTGNSIKHWQRKIVVVHVFQCIDKQRMCFKMMTWIWIFLFSFI